MKFKWTALSICAVFAFGLHAALRDKVETDFDFSTAIGVLLERRVVRFELQALGGDLYLKSRQNQQWKKIGRKAQIEIQRRGKKFSLSVNHLSLYSDPLYLRGLSPYSVFRFHGNTYRGMIRVERKEDSLLVVNIIPVEDYLMGTIGSEMSPTWPMEALKAQAVASRGYALYMKKHPKDKAYDLEKDIRDQVYGGTDLESKKVIEAVRTTESQYLTANGELPKTYFHSRCGGTTETSASVWNERTAHHHSVPCPYCRKNPYVWSARLEFDPLARFLGLSKLDPLRILPTKTSLSGRLLALKFSSPSGEKWLSTDEFRALVGYTRIKSAQFNWQIEHQQVKFQGVGSGHGVGMCQWGAKHLADEGKNYKEILAHYYPRLTLMEGDKTKTTERRAGPNPFVDSLRRRMVRKQ